MTTLQTGMCRFALGSDPKRPDSLAIYITGGQGSAAKFKTSLQCAFEN